MEHRITREELSSLLTSAKPPLLLEALPPKYFEDLHLPGARNMPHDAVAELLLEGFTTDGEVGDAGSRKRAQIAINCSLRTCTCRRRCRTSKRSHGGIDCIQCRLRIEETRITHVIHIHCQLSMSCHVANIIGREHHAGARAQGTEPVGAQHLLGRVDVDDRADRTSRRAGGVAGRGQGDGGARGRDRGSGRPPTAADREEASHERE